MASRRRNGDGNESWGRPARPAKEPGARPVRLAAEELETEAPEPARRRRKARAVATPARREIRTLH